MSQPANDYFSQHLSDGEESNHEEASDTGAAPKQPQQMIPQTTVISISNSNSKKEMVTPRREFQLEEWRLIDAFLQLLLQRFKLFKRKVRLRIELLMAIPKEHMRRFHGMDDAKEIWEAIRTRFQQLLLNWKLMGRRSTEDSNHKFLRSLPSAWSNLAMTMRTNPEIDNLSIDDLYNNLRVFEQEIQGAPKPSSSAQNVAFCRFHDHSYESLTMKYRIKMHKIKNFIDD
ncbi:hypothetical protein Tco_0428532 [Tanacetum coccineum]